MYEISPTFLLFTFQILEWTLDLPLDPGVASLKTWFSVDFEKLYLLHSATLFNSLKCQAVSSPQPPNGRPGHYLDICLKTDYLAEGRAAFRDLNSVKDFDNRDFKQIATTTSTTAVVDAVSWGEYVSYIARQISSSVLAHFLSL